MFQRRYLSLHIYKPNPTEPWKVFRVQRERYGIWDKLTTREMLTNPTIWNDVHVAFKPLRKLCVHVSIIRIKLPF